MLILAFQYSPRDVNHARSLLVENTRDLVTENTKISLLSVNICSRFHKRNYIPRWIESGTNMERDILYDITEVINMSFLSEWFCLLECYVVINESSQSQFKY